MFDLTTADLTGRTVVDVAAGAADFTAAATEIGACAVAIDELYRLSPAAIADAITASSRPALGMVDDHPDRFTWEWYGDRAARDTMRSAAAVRFTADLAARPSSYIAGALPQLPLRDGIADLALCSHLLFTWAGQFDQTWHRAAILELLRVAAEVRIFPLVLLGTGDPVEWLAELTTDLAQLGHDVECRPAAYRFQTSATEALIIRSAN